METRSGSGVLVTPGARHQELTLMRPDDTAPSGAVLIPLRAHDGSVRAYAIVDAEDAERVNQWRWSLDADGYVIRGSYTAEGRKTTIKLHRELLGLRTGDGIEGDHFNRIRTDNRRVNLRAATRAQNGQNRGPKGETSKCRGVYFDRDRGKWVAQLRRGGKVSYAGSYLTEAEAAQAASDARRAAMPFSVEDQQ
jgi:hypothetical protein